MENRRTRFTVCPLGTNSERRWPQLPGHSVNTSMGLVYSKFAWLITVPYSTLHCWTALRFSILFSPDLLGISFVAMFIGSGLLLLCLSMYCVLVVIIVQTTAQLTQQTDIATGKPSLRPAPCLIRMSCKNHLKKPSNNKKISNGLCGY